MLLLFQLHHGGVADRAIRLQNATSSARYAAPIFNVHYDIGSRLFTRRSNVIGKTIIALTEAVYIVMSPEIRGGGRVKFYVYENVPTTAGWTLRIRQFVMRSNSARGVLQLLDLA